MTKKAEHISPYQAKPTKLPESRDYTNVEVKER